MALRSRAARPRTWKEKSARILSVLKNFEICQYWLPRSSTTPTFHASPSTRRGSMKSRTLSESCSMKAFTPRSRDTRALPSHSMNLPPAWSARRERRGGGGGGGSEWTGRAEAQSAGGGV